MGLRIPIMDFIESSIKQVFGENTKGLRMLELGDQVVKIPKMTGKEYFTAHGYKHTSVDINGLHGALVRDLTKPEQFEEWHGLYDIITNAGTAEHVEPFESQYECFNIIHDCLKVGSVAIHILPDVHEHDDKGAWVGHCHFYYSHSFFKILAEECGYVLLSSELIRSMRCVAMKKIIDVPFMEDRSQFLSTIARRFAWLVVEDKKEPNAKD